MEFKVGDIVEWCGAKGRVINWRPTGFDVLFNGSSIDGVVINFKTDGRYLNFHKEPSLKIIERPKQKVKKYKVLYVDDTKNYFLTNDYYSSEYEFKQKNHFYHLFVRFIEETMIEAEE